MSADHRLRLELAEEAVLSDPDREHGRRTLGDGTVLDLSSYVETGVVLAFRRTSGLSVEFIGFAFHEPG